MHVLVRLSACLTPRVLQNSTQIGLPFVLSIRVSYMQGNV